MIRKPFGAPMKGGASDEQGAGKSAGRASWIQAAPGRRQRCASERLCKSNRSGWIGNKAAELVVYAALAAAADFQEQILTEPTTLLTTPPDEQTLRDPADTPNEDIIPRPLRALCPRLIPPIYNRPPFPGGEVVFCFALHRPFYGLKAYPSLKRCAVQQVLVLAEPVHQIATSVDLPARGSDNPLFGVYMRLKSP